jgi:hypothetical protein
MVWRKEYLQGTGVLADFNNSTKTDIADFMVWRKVFLK